MCLRVNTVTAFYAVKCLLFKYVLGFTLQLKGHLSILSKGVSTELGTKGSNLNSVIPPVNPVW